jgi:phage baseplate assembly protein W
MVGMDSITGKHVSGVARLRQSIGDILRTPIGSRVMRREYGSNLFNLIDAPLNQYTVVEIFAATAEALQRWEPELSVQKVNAVSASPGSITIEINATYLPTGEPIFLDGIDISKNN